MPALYKGMANLLLTASPTDAVKIKSAMDRAYRAANVQIPPTSKAWDAHRSYEKRLLKIAAKSTLFAPAKATPGRTSGAMSDSGGELSEDDDGLPARGERILPTPVRAGQKRDRAEAAAGEEEQEEDVSMMAPASDGGLELDVEMPASDADSLQLDEEEIASVAKRRKV